MPMRILVISDTHGELGNFLKVMDIEKKVDLCVHLGDIEGQENEIADLVSCPLFAVRGNNDFFSPLPYDIDVKIGSYQAFLTHGHHYGVSVGEGGVLEEARARGANLVMFGHTHRPVLREEEGIILVNPGSISYPRQEDRKPSYMIITINERNGKAEFEQKFLKS